jgi:hypothetical protein
MSASFIVTVVNVVIIILIILGVGLASRCFVDLVWSSLV